MLISWFQIMLDEAGGAVDVAIRAYKKRDRSRTARGELSPSVSFELERARWVARRDHRFHLGGTFSRR